MLEILTIILSLGAVNALIPILVIMVLLVAAAGLNRGYSLFNLFGITTLAGINPAGKASIAGKSSFSVLLLGFPGGGNAGKVLNVGARIKSRLTARAHLNKRVAIIKDSYNTSAGFGRTHIGGKILDRAAAARVASGRSAKPGRLATTYTKFVTSKKLGASKRMMKGTKRVAAAVERISEGGAGKGKLEQRLGTVLTAKPVRGTIRASRGTINAPSKLRKVWDNRHASPKSIISIRGKTLVTTSTLKKVAGVGALTLVNPALGAAFAAAKVAQSIKRTQTKKYQETPKEDTRLFKSLKMGIDPTKIKHPSKNWNKENATSQARQIIAAVAPLPYFAYSAAQLGNQRARNWKTARDWGSVEKIGDATVAGTDAHKLRSIVKDFAQRAGGDVNKLSPSEKRGLNRELRTAIKEMDRSDNVSSGARSRLTATAALYGAVHLGKEVIEGGRMGGGKEAAKAGAARIKKNFMEMGANPESTNPARMARAIANVGRLAYAGRPHGAMPFLGGSAGVHAPLDSIGQNTAAGKTARDLLQHVQEKSMLHSKDPVALENHRVKVEADISKIDDTIKKLAATDPIQKRMEEEQRKQANALLATIGRNQNSSTSTLDALSKSPDTDVMAAVAGNKSTGLTTLVSLANPSEPESVRVALAGNKSANAALLGSLSTTGTDAVKEAITHNQNTPDYILKALASDPSDSVKNAAKIELRKRGLKP